MTRNATQPATPAATLAEALANTWEPEADLNTVRSFDAMRGGDLASRVCLRIAKAAAAADGGIECVTDSGWEYVGRSTVGGMGRGFDRVPYTHDTYERSLRIEACLLDANGLHQFAVMVRVYRYGKGGRVRCACGSADEMVGVQMENGGAYIYESTVQKALVLRALGM